ncbi:MAG: helix-turn-helix transcriptional regulator [Ruminococcus sp.]|nr:helix-turn-helix transcriptional regulator [Ruminococcus sp.]
MKFSDKLRFLIEERNLTQKQVAQDLNIAPSTMGGYVQGMSQPDFDTLKILAEYFDVTSDYLLDIPSKKTNNKLENELLRVFRSIPNEYKTIYIKQGKAFIK